MRPKGIMQKRDEKKYWLPKGVKLIDTFNNPNYRKEHKLLFEDEVHGTFISSFKAIQGANASTHPEAIKLRRESTNIERYGVTNPGANIEVYKKRTKTMLERHGYKHALQNPELLKKSRETLRKNYNVDEPMYSSIILNRMKENNLNKYNVENVMKLDEVKNKLKETNLKKHGYDNASKSPKVIEKILQSQIENKENGHSKGELELKIFIESLGFKTKKSFIGGKDPKEIDIDVIDLNLCFEFNGAYWHSEVNPKMTPNYHLNKTINCKKRLIQIFDFEWQNRKSQLKSFIRSALGKNEKIIYARKCKIEQIDKLTAKNFLDKYHILGKVNFKYCYGLRYNNELLCLITLNNHHRTNSELILNRYICKENITVIGGLSKLSKHAFKKHGRFSTWIDRRFSDGSNWIKNGWKLIHTIKPDYFYIDSKTSKIISKQSRKKSKVNTPKNMTEHEHALLDKLYRVYDCGKIKLTYDI